MAGHIDHIRFHVRHTGWRLPVFVGLMAFDGIVDAVGIAMFLPLVELSMAQGGQVSELSKSMLSVIRALGLPSSLTGVLLLMCGLFIAKGCVMFISKLLMAIMRINLEEKQRAYLANAIRGAGYGYVMSRKVSDFSALFDTEIQGVLRNLQALTQLFGAMATVTIYVIAAFWVDPVVGAISVLFGVVLGVGFRGITRRIQRISRDVTATNLDLESLFLDYLGSYKYLKATETSGAILLLVRRELNRRRILFIRSNILRAIVDSSLEPLAVIIVAIFIFMMVEVQGQTLAPIILSLAYLYRSLSRVGTVHQGWQTFASSVGSIEAVQREYAALEQAREATSGKPAARLNDRISAEDVSVELAGQRVLDRVSVEIRKGEMIGIVGETGAGKSTLADVVAGLRTPDSGRVLRDGVDYRQLDLASARIHNGYVTQEPILFHGSVAANVSLWLEEPAAHAGASPKLMDALRRAKALDFVEVMPNGVATAIGNRGHRLSGGQIQRLAIAREFYRDSDLLIFDEATSALDAQTDHLVIQALRSFAEERAVLMISHRLTNLRWCNRIFVVSQGRIERSGTWDELNAEKSGWFSQAMALQQLPARTA